MNHEATMKLAAQKAKKTMRAGIGGPFGAVIVGPDDAIVAISSNSVLRDNDPTAHAEVNAIRQACKLLGTHDLSGCTLYATGAPCPMCMSAIMWANIKKVYISGLPEDADAIGFRDDFMYKFIEDGCSDKEVMSITKLDRSIATDLYAEYKEKEKQLY